MNLVPVLLVLASLNLSTTPADYADPSEPTDYKTAYKRAMKGDKPLLVLVTAEWCPPCRMMKQNTIPQLLNNKGLDSFHFATVDLDKNAKDARNLIGNGQVPQLILFKKNEQGKWKTKSMTGFASVEIVKSFLGTPEAVRTAEAETTSIDQ